MHDPFQNYPSLGSYYGMPAPIGLPYLAAFQASTMGLPSIPQPYGSLGLQHPLLASLLSNPLIAAGLHPSALGSYMGPQLGLQRNSRIGQIGSQFGQAPYPAPQSCVGQGGLFGAAQGFGAIHPLLSQLAARPFQSQGFSPWGY